MTLEQIQDFDFKVGDKFLYKYHTANNSIILCVGCICSINSDEIRFIDLEAVNIKFIGTTIMTFDDIFTDKDSLILAKLQGPSLLELAQQTYPEHFIRRNLEFIPLQSRLTVLSLVQILKVYT